MEEFIIHTWINTKWISKRSLTSCSKNNPMNCVWGSCHSVNWSFKHLRLSSKYIRCHRFCLKTHLYLQARKKNCSHDVAGTHTTFCDQIYPELADWALGCGIEALAVSLYCVILMVIFCTTRRIDSSRFEDSEYHRWHQIMRCKITFKDLKLLIFKESALL